MTEDQLEALVKDLTCRSEIDRHASRLQLAMGEALRDLEECTMDHEVRPRATSVIRELWLFRAKCDIGLTGLPETEALNILRKHLNMTEPTTQPTPNLQPNQQSVIAERDELRERIVKLTLFINTQAFLDIQYAEQRRLIRQQTLMNELRDVLDERIAALKPAKVGAL